jgi:hypothetical protein
LAWALLAMLILGGAVLVSVINRLWSGTNEIAGKSGAVQSPNVAMDR